MMRLLKQAAWAHDAKLALLSIERLPDLENEIRLFENSEALNGFQKWIVNHLYKFEAPATEFGLRSIIIIAIPHPAYAKAEFVRQGRTYNFTSLIMSDFAKAAGHLYDVLAPRNYHMQSASNLPLKRLAARSGLAVYGRNNICYVDGLGSFFSLAAYFSDVPAEPDDWTEMRQADLCAHCQICFNHCPTGAIRADRFLIDNERCLSYFNERPDEFPEWLPLSSHHCVYDCLKCQLNCPMNTAQVGHIPTVVKFSADETELLLSGSPWATLPPALQQKAKILGLADWLSAIPRNLKVLFELADLQRDP